MQTKQNHSNGQNLNSNTNCSESKKRKFEIFKDWFDELETNEQVNIWNSYCKSINDYDKQIISYMEMEDLLKGKEPFDIANLFYMGQDENNKKVSANPNRDWFTFNGYGNIVSLENPFYRYGGNFTSYYDDTDIEEMFDTIEENEIYLEYFEEGFKDYIEREN